jgi:hypothetical protein
MHVSLSEERRPRMDPKPTNSDGLLEAFEVCDLEGILLEDLSG